MIVRPLERRQDALCKFPARIQIGTCWGPSKTYKYSFCSRNVEFLFSNAISSISAVFFTSHINTMDLPTTTESWVHVPDNCDFPLENLPFGVFSTKSLRPRIGVAIGNEVLDLKFLVEEGVLTSSPFDLGPLRQPKLNQYARLGKRAHSWVRAFLGRLLDQKTDLGSLLRDNVSRRRQALHSLDDVKMHLPMDIGNFTDFFAGKYHAQNVRLILSHEVLEANRDVQVRGDISPRSRSEPQLLPSSHCVPWTGIFSSRKRNASSPSHGPISRRRCANLRTYTHA